MIRRLFRPLAAALGIAAVLALGACAPSASGSGPAVTADPNQALYESVIAADNAAAIAFQGASNLASLCKIPASSIASVNAAFAGVSAGLSQANADIQATPPNTSGAQVAYTAALASLQAVQATLAAVPVSKAETASMVAKAKASRAPASSTTTQVISLIIEDLPVLLSSGSQLAGVIQTYVNQLGGGTSGTTYTPADVKTADTSQTAALAVWAAASKTVCK
ncbi:MAG TPA: hypothetical protein VN821_08635 [Candidatus Udaeobacter sp.]|jgi:hypothetical protein|nr:hypothetical protein [Candidatus Udaeobacter sp.]